MSEAKGLPRLSRRAALAGAAVLGGGALLQPWRGAGDGPDPSKPFVLPAHSLDGRTIVITGANTGLGFESARRLAAAGAHVVITARSYDKGAEAISRLRALVGEDAQLKSVALDLADLRSVRSFPSRLDAALGAGAAVDVLMNNAGVMAIPERRTTADGFERQLGVNHLGHFALVAAMLPYLRRAPAGFRVINVASAAHEFVSGEQFSAALDARLDPPAYSAWGNYGLSKAANILFSNELQRRLEASGVRGTAVSLHPGVVDTDLGRFIGAKSASGGVAAVEAGVPMDTLYASMDERLKAVLTRVKTTLLKPVELGANTQVFLAAAADNDRRDLAANGGGYYEKMQLAKPKAFTDDQRLAARLWDLSEQLADVKITFM